MIPRVGSAMDGGWVGAAAFLSAGANLLGCVMYRRTAEIIHGSITVMHRDTVRRMTDNYRDSGNSREFSISIYKAYD